MMNEQTLTAAAILDAAEDVLRRYGPAKANVVDVARALGVSHGSVYRHFASKAALRDAVIERWLSRVSDPLEAIAGLPGPAEERLRRWFHELREFKRDKARKDPALFATYNTLALEAGDSIASHVEHLTGQLARIIADGAAQGVFSTSDPAGSAAAAFDAAMRFHNPAFAADWGTAENDAAFERVFSLVLRGLSAR
jgi:AcrR family transcriptional regulator